MKSILDERLSVNGLVKIDGQEFKFVSLQIDQEYGQHHYFSITLDYDVIDKRFMNNPLEHMDLISKTLTIDIQHGNDNGNAYVFKGVITDVKMTGHEGKHGYLIIEGASPTIMLERGKRMDVFSNMTLKKVVNEVMTGVYNDYLTCVCNPSYENNIDFLMQYNETDWEFLRRLSSLYGESFFFSGSELLFGQYEEWQSQPLIYDREIISYQLCSKLLPNKFTNYQYLVDQDHIIENKSLEEIDGANTFVQKAFERSKDLTEENPVYVPSPIVVGDPGELKEITNRRKANTAAETIVFKGVAKTCHPRIGRVYTISLPSTISGNTELGTYRVTKVRHIIDQNNRYRNEFEAVPAKLKYMPVPELKIPMADSVLATVISNDDPLSLGRVQVDFPFSQVHHSELWLRVMTPDAGGLVGEGDSKSGEIERNRGIVFIPEIGDQVMVGFEMGDPNRPYVMGSMFHGKNSSGAAANNTIKTIITRSGHILEFNDNEESLGITVKDRNGNVIHMDTKGKNIEITAPETITMNAKNININADEDITMISGKNTYHNAGENFVQSVGKDSRITIEEKFNISVFDKMDLIVEKEFNQNVHDKLSQIAKSMNLTADSGTLKLASQDDMTLKSGSDVIIAQ